MIYTTSLGDTWDMIAHKIYGNTVLMPLLINANSQHVDTVVFSAGVLLQVPPEPAELPTDLPPWRR